MFTHLHVHTEYSLLDGASRIADLVGRAKELGMHSLAITDHGVMYGAIEFYKECKKQGIRPIIGCEVYVAKRSRFEKESGKDSDRGHLVLLAKNMTGYKNLINIVSKAFIEGYYYKPRVDHDLLRENSEGLIASSACLGGEIPNAILAGNYEKAKEIALFYNEIFGQGNFYLEVQGFDLREQITVNNEIIKLSKELGIPLIATNDVHYVRKEDAKYQDILLCIQTGKTVNEEGRLRFPSDSFYLKSYEEMAETFSYVPEALENTNKIAEMCNLEFEFGKLQLPKFDVPEGYTSEEYLRKLCLDGFEKKYGKDNKEAMERFEYELGVINSMGFTDYFLIVWDFIKFSHDNGIAVGPGRGSAAGSIISYTLDITSVDPFKYNLLFERFLNPERITMPDIDIDFCYERRQEVIEYVIRKYGADRVAQIVTFGTMAARGAIRDVGRALDMSYQEVDFIAKQVPFETKMTIKKALDVNPELKKMYDEDERVKELIDTAMALEGLPRHSSTHAAGVVIAKNPITQMVPVHKTDEAISTQYQMTTLEELGILKMDFLGLRTLTVIRDTVNLAKENYNVDIDINNINMLDKDVYKELSEGKASGVFQLESAGMRQLLKELKPGCIEDIIAAVALYRPGPMDQIPTYIKYKNNPGNMQYLHPALENILQVTYGTMIYQEQVLQIVQELAGYSLGRADLVRRAMGKKKMDVMEKERQNFIHGIVREDGTIEVEGAVKRGISEEIANKIFDQMIDFASYAFNKAHSTCYGVIAYQTAWLKVHYPQEFMASLLNSIMGNTDKVALYIEECKAMGINILPPDINQSREVFTVDGKNIRFGLGALKNVGIGAIKSIVKEFEENGPYESFEDFCYRVQSSEVNKRCIESLIKGGAFDSLEIYRSQLMAVFEKLLDGIGEGKKKNFDGQMSLFDINGDNKDAIKYEYPNIKEYPKKELLSMEKEISGLYLSGHPLAEFEKELQTQVTASSVDFKASEVEGSDGVILNYNVKDGNSVTIGGIITNRKTKTTKNNKIMAFLTLEDVAGSIEVIVFPNVYEKYLKFVEKDNIVLVKGRITAREEEEPKIICEEIKPLTKNEVKKLYLKVKENEIENITPILKYFNGAIPVYLYFEEDKSIKMASKELWVNLNENLIEKLKTKLGEDNVKVV